MTKAELELTVPTDREARLAGDLARAIDAVSRHPGAFALRVQAEGEEPETLELPDAAVASLRVILAAMAEGRPIAVHAADKDVTIDQAADVLNVSRATVLMLIEQGQLPARPVAERQTIPLADLLAYKRDVYVKRQAVLDEMVASDQELGLR